MYHSTAEGILIQGAIRAPQTSDCMTKEANSDATLEGPSEEGRELRLVDIVAALGHEKKLILGLPLIVAFITALITLFLPPQFTASTTFLVPQQQQSVTAAALQQLGNLAGIPAVGSGVRKPEDLYIAMLQTEALQNGVIRRLGLMKRFGTHYWEDARNRLSKVIAIRASKAGLLIVEATDRDPTFAAELANAQVDELRRLLGNLAVTEAQQRRLFLEQQLAATKDNLIKAEGALRQTQERTGVIALDKQGEAIIRAAADLRAQIVTREVQLQTMRTFAAPQNADLQRILSEIAGLKDQLQKLEAGQAGGPGDVMIPTAKVPQVGLEYVRAVREVKYQEAIFEILVRQFELAKVDEAREGPVIQQIDVASPPERRSGPKRRQIVTTWTFIAALIGVAIALGRAKWRAWRAEPNGPADLERLKNAWLISRR